MENTTLCMSGKDCAKLCTRCGKHPQNTRKAVRKGLCCNKCPNHGPWCTMHSADPPCKRTSFIRAQSCKGLLNFLQKNRRQSLVDKLARVRNSVSDNRSSAGVAVRRIVAHGLTSGRQTKRRLHVYEDFIDIAETQVDKLEPSENRNKRLCRRPLSPRSGEILQNAKGLESIDDAQDSNRIPKVTSTAWVDANAVCDLMGKLAASETNAQPTLDSQAAIETQIVDEIKRMETAVCDEMLKLKLEIEQYEEKLNTTTEKLHVLRSTEAVRVSALKAECAAKVCSLQESIQRLDLEISQIERDRSVATEELIARKHDLKYRIENCGQSQDTQQIDAFRSAVMEDLENLLKPMGTNRNSPRLSELREKRSSIQDELRATSDEYKQRKDNLPIVQEVKDLQARRSLLYTELDWLQVKYSELAHHAKSVS